MYSTCVDTGGDFCSGDFCSGAVAGTFPFSFRAVAPCAVVVAPRSCQTPPHPNRSSYSHRLPFTPPPLIHTTACYSQHLLHPHRLVLFTPPPPIRTASWFHLCTHIVHQLELGYRRQDRLVLQKRKTWYQNRAKTGAFHAPCVCLHWDVLVLASLCGTEWTRGDMRVDV